MNMFKKAFQIVGAILILSVLLTACQSAQTPPPTVAPAPTQAVAAPTQTAAAPKVSGQLNYLGWEGYDDAAAFKPLYDQTGLVLNTTYVGTNDEVITKLKAGGQGTYDVGDINARYLNLMVSTGMLMPLDESRLPNLKDLFPAFKGQNFGYVNGKLYAIPAFFGTTSICYRADKVSEPDWNFFQKPEYQGKYAVSSNGLSDTYLWAMALGLGQDATKWTQADLAKIKARGMEEFSHAATMITGGGGEMTDLLVRGDVVLVTDCWDQVAVNAQKQGVNVKSVTPAGSIKATLDIYFMFAGAKNVDAGYAWLNQAISAQAMATMAKDYGSAVTNVKAFDLMDAAFKQSLNFPTLNDTIKRTEFNVMPNPDATAPNVSLDDITKAFEEIKASSSVPVAPTATPAK
jgi:spermidine/putrescine transport system substrate-binding protein